MEYEKRQIENGNCIYVDKNATIDQFSKTVDPKDYSYDLNKVRFAMMWDVTTLFRFFAACHVISTYANKWRCKPTVVDLGCSTASLAHLYFRSFKAINIPAINYVGVDWRLSVLEKNVEYKFRTPTRFIQCDVGNLLLPEEIKPIDIFIAMEVIEHISKECGLNMLKIMYDNLKSDGVLFITSPNTPPELKVQMGSDVQWPENHVYEWGVYEMEEELIKLGFEIEGKWGWAPRTREVRKSIDEKYGRLFSNLTDIFPPSIVGPFLAAMDVDNCRGWMIIARKP